MTPTIHIKKGFRIGDTWCGKRDPHAAETPAGSNCWDCARAYSQYRKEQK